MLTIGRAACPDSYGLLLVLRVDFVIDFLIDLSLRMALVPQRSLEQ
jgi:hypothetical protein